MLKPQRLTGILCGLGRRTGASARYDVGVQSGPESARTDRGLAAHLVLAERG